MLDTVCRVETPEGIALQLRTAGVLPRTVAWVIDFLVRVVALIVCSTLLAFLGATGQGLYLLAFFAVFWLYPILFEVLRDGQTIGKRVMGLRVIHANGTPVGWLASIVRNLLRTVDMLPICYGFGFVAGLLDPQGRRLGDMVAGTLVVHVAAANAGAGAPNAPVVMPDVALSAAEKQAIIAFAERAPQLTPERQAELAGLMPQLTRAQGALAVQRLLGMANGFLGRS